MKHRRRLFALFVLAFLAYLLLFPRQAFQSSLRGLDLWFHTVLPSLLPFIILSNLVLRMNLIRSLPAPLSAFCSAALGLSCEGTYAWLLGMFCGYPMGARLTAELYRQNRISRNEALYLLTFSNNASPVFLSTYVVLTGFSDPAMALPVFAVLYLSMLLTSVVFRFVCGRFRTDAGAVHKNEAPKQPSCGNLLDTSILDGFEVVTRLGGYIILFSILSGILTALPAPLHDAAPLLAGVTEITTGIAALAGCSWPWSVKTVCILACTAFGGISAAAQTACMIRDSGLPLSLYLRGKLCCAAIAAVLGLLFVLIV